MEITREIELDAEPEDVWAALTDAAQLEEWFANEVELDPTPGGRGVFRWDNGETREAVVESVEEGARIVLRFDDDGIVDLRVVRDRGRQRRAGPRDGAVLVDRARVPGPGVVRDPVDAVFSALADPSRRFVVETLAARGTATPTELAAELPVTRQAVAKHLAALRERRARRGDAVRARDAVRADAGTARVGGGWIEEVGAAWDERLAALKRLVEAGGRVGVERGSRASPARTHARAS